MVLRLLLYYYIALPTLGSYQVLVYMHVAGRFAQRPLGRFRVESFSDRLRTRNRIWTMQESSDSTEDVSAS